MTATIRENEQNVLVCPLCGASGFAPAGQELLVKDILQRWGKEASVRFGPDVWQDYAPPAPQQVSLHRCPKCSLRMFLPPLVGTAGFYRDVTASDYYVPDKWEFLRAIKELKKVGPKRVMDIGCGSGFFLDRVKEALPKDCDVWGYEFDPKLAQKAQSRGHSVCSGNLSGIPSGKNGEAPFDALTSFQVLEHVADPASFMRQAHSILKPGGLFIVCVPDATGPVRHFTNALTDMPPHHVTRWCADSFTLGMPGLGYRVVEIAYEPLPHFLWDFYVPVILEKDFWFKWLGRWMNRSGTTALMIKMLRKMGFRWLRGVRGHTLYVTLQAVEQPKEQRGTKPSWAA